jgi:trehalose/maltose hydrolase-like predicted phosphorylase
VLFGFKGAMFAWTAAYEGRAFGCCNGTGAWEDCLEHHVTPAVGFAAWQYYQATHNVTWLRQRGYPLLQEIAEFLMSRVTSKGNDYWITGVLPIDEWCADSGCGCSFPGVDNDAEMNGASIASLLAAARAAEILGVATQRTSQYLAVAQNITLLFNSSGGGHHDQFNSPACPGGWGGHHYLPNDTVCPEDVMLLSYPFGDVLDIPLAETRADAELFIPLTCMENPGMTTPIHTIVWLSLFESTKAQAEFNRSLYAACYGPFNVRNEVDKHVDIYGGHFDNSHFLTGDGGYLQALINGFSGLRITDQGLRLLRPSLPSGVTQLRLRRVLFRSLILTIVVSSSALNIDGDVFCIKDGKGGVQRFQQHATLSFSSYAYPGLLYEC